ncbi:MAG: hypothetical protein WKF79_02970 [Nocardioides sp.]
MSDAPGFEPHRDAAERAQAGYDAVSAYVDLVEAEWNAAGLNARTRRRLAVELEDSLVSALAAGASLDDLVAVEAATLATDIAVAEGVSSQAPNSSAPTPSTLRGLLIWGVGSATAMAGFVWFFLVIPIADTFYNDSSTGALIASLVIIYGIYGALTLSAAAGGMTHYLRQRDDTRATVALATAAMALGGVAGVAICMAVARLTNYSSAPAVILTYVAIVGLLSSAAITFTWHRRPARVSQAQPSM